MPECPKCGSAESVKNGRHPGRHAIAFIENQLIHLPDQSVELLAYAYDVAQIMPDKSRYAQYQSRYFDFNIKPNEKVLDMGSGHIPFPLATHFADIALEDDSVGRGGVAFKNVAGKPVFECDIEKTPFADKEFDFVYCSHVLEHVKNPEIACKELMRIGKRGYIECPSRGKDMFFSVAAISNHIWAVDCLNGILRFTEYSEEEKKGVRSRILLDMNCTPRSQREKAVAALDIVSASTLNTMLLWEGGFQFEIYRQKAWPSSVRGPQKQNGASPLLEEMSVFAGGIKPRLTTLVNKLRSRLACIIAP
ncbi:MAG: class I SAM-dependent methyltransferase [Desulfovibrio sp.]|jgi:hypothetical protein|nr:class I SAM-dependent methyltransferase [Desulfovibrio sp.]